MLSKPIEEGKKYVTKDKSIIGPMKPHSNSTSQFKWTGQDQYGTDWYYFSDGTWGLSNAGNFELMSEHKVDAPVTPVITVQPAEVMATQSKHKCSCQWEVVWREGCKCGGY